MNHGNILNIQVQLDFKLIYISRNHTILKKLSLGFNLRRRSNIVGSLYMYIQYCIQCFKIQAGPQLKPVFGGFEMRLKFIKFGL